VEAISSAIGMPSIFGWLGLFGVLAGGFYLLTKAVGISAGAKFIFVTFAGIILLALALGLWKA
jgi:hypothetical protein